MPAPTTGRALHPVVPAEPWRDPWSVRVNAVGMRAAGALGGQMSRWLGARVPAPLGILMYHRIAPITRGVAAPPFNVTPEVFTRQLAGLRQRGFHFISLRDVLIAHDDEARLPEPAVVVTFDDCFESVYTHAWPILRELAVPSTLFLSTAYLDSPEPFPFDTWAAECGHQVPADHYRPIRTEQCLQMLDSGRVELGTHTHTHADFRGHPDAFAQELRVSANILRHRFGVGQPSFSLPYGNPRTGHATSAMLEAARASGAVCALTTQTTLVDVMSSPFGWGRFNVSAWDTAASLAGKLHGWYDWAPALKRRFAR